MINTFHHVSFTVRDIEQSIAFYQNLGFIILSDRRSLDYTYLRKTTGFTEAIMHIALLSGNNLNLELIEFVHPKGIDLDKSNNNVGSSHIGFLVEDIEEEVNRLRESGVRFRSDPVTVDTGPNKGRKIVYFYDPDGYTLEFISCTTTSL
jgi:lactoylglutathione lyase